MTTLRIIQVTTATRGILLLALTVILGIPLSGRNVEVTA